MVWRRSEGETFRYGINWDRDARTHVEINLFWRGLTNYYRVGLRLRRRQHGSLCIWRPFRRIRIERTA